MAGNTVKVSYDILNREANEVLTQIRKIQANWERLSEVVERTKGYWEGEASNQHRMMFLDIKQDMEGLMRKLDEHPKDLYEIAKVYAEAEQKVSQMASALPADVIQ